MRRTAALLALLIAACRPAADGAADIRLAGAWARATAPAQRSSAAYLTIANPGGAADRLVAVTSSTGPASLHSSSMDGGIMRMRSLKRLPVAAGSTVALEPGGAHVMLTRLEQPLEAGQAIRLTLRFENSGERSIVARVRGSESAQ